MRAVPLFLGVLTLAIVWLAPQPEWIRHSFSAHMTIHMTVVAISAPLLALGLTGSAWDPARRAPRLFSPLPASLVELAVVWIWHTPALSQAAHHDNAALFAEQTMFLGAGLLLWFSALGERTGAGIIALLLTVMHMTLLGALIALSPRLLYEHFGGLAKLSPLDDQHLGGAIMLVVGGLSYLAGGLWLAADLLRAKHCEAI